MLSHLTTIRKTAKTSRWLKTTAISLTLAGLAPNLAFASETPAATTKMPSIEQMWALLNAQQEEIKNLRAQVERLSIETVSLTEADRQKIDALSTQVASNSAAVEATTGLVETALNDETGAGGSLRNFRGAGWARNTTIGGYGELHYNGGDADEIDFHRFVLYANHRFNDWIEFQGELELEHSFAGEDEPGEVELEQAFLDLNLSKGFGLQFGDQDSHHIRAGVVLTPVGILNETHEPNTFYGVERNRVENVIIPTTWREGGFGLTGQLGAGFSYDLYYTSGLDIDTEGSNPFRVRSGRQNVAEASAESPAYTARIKWTGLPGVELAASLHKESDITQGESDIDATLYEAHAIINQGGFGLRALYARWDIDSNEAEFIGRDEQYGWYIEPSYRFNLSPKFGDIGFFARYEAWNTEAGLDLDSKNETTHLGFNYWPHPNVVFKLDYQWESLSFARDGDDRINLGLGYQF